MKEEEESDVVLHAVIKARTTLFTQSAVTNLIYRNVLKARQETDGGERIKRVHLQSGRT